MSLRRAVEAVVTESSSIEVSEMIPRRMLYLLSAFAVTGCAISPPTEVARVFYSKPMVETAQMIEEMAEKCWKRGETLMQDGIAIDARMSLYDSALISAARWASDIGVREDFLIVEVLSESEESSEIVIREGDFGCSLNGSCSSLGLHKDVVRWIEGDLTCGNHRRGGQ